MFANRPTHPGSIAIRSAFLLLALSVTSAGISEQNVSVLQGRQFASVAHNTEDNQYLLFGGTDGHKRFEDTWLFGSSGWKSQNTIASPEERISSAVAYDSRRDQYVLFGGRVKNTRPALCSPGNLAKGLKDEFFCRDTWIFRARIWIRQRPDISPPERELHAMAYDAASGQVVLFGGMSSTSTTPLADTWVWNGFIWKQIVTAHKPPARFWHSMAYDPINQQVVMFGGDSGSKILNDTWLWNGRDWSPAPAQITPPDFYTGAGMEYSSTLRKMVLFSGLTWTGQRVAEPSSNSWTWDGHQWKKLPPADFQLVTDFSKLTATQVRNGILASGTPTMLWVANQAGSSCCKNGGDKNDQ